MRKHNIDYRRGRQGEGFYLDFTVRGHRVRAWGGKTLTEAKLELGRLRAEMTAAWKVPSKDMMFSEFGREFLDLYSKPNKRSWRRDVVSINSLSGFFHGETLRSLTAAAVERFKATRLTQVSPATVNRELACLRTLLNKAMDWGRLESNPAARVKKLREAPPRERILTDAETRRLLDAAAPHLRPILVVLLNTGMRKGEALGLCWDDVDLVKGFIHISDSKSGKSRNIPMNAAVFTTVRELSEVNGPMVLRDTDRPGGDGQDIQRTALVFGGIKDVKRSFHTACRRADIKGLRLHDLRHTCASRLVQLGVDLVTVSKLLGHSSITMTMRYSHPTPENMRRAVEKLGENYRAVFYQSAGQTVFASSSRRIMNFLSPR